MKRKLAVVLLLSILLAAIFAVPTAAAAPDLTKLFAAKTHVTSDGYRLNYRIYVPDSYTAEKQYPVLLFMHGAMYIGDDNTAQLGTGVTEGFAMTSCGIYDCIVIAPQCPTGNKWVDVATWNDCSYSTDAIPESDELKAVMDLLGTIKKTYSTDERRYYVTGLSMGGFATWDLITRHPDVFAAAVPVCGGADYRKAELIRDMPIWTFHGLKDPTVPCTGTQKMVAELKALDAPNLKFTEFPDKEHDIWYMVYSSFLTWQWMFSKVKPEAPAEETTTAVETTAPVATDGLTVELPDVTTAEQTEETKGGCGSTLGILPVGVFLAVAGLAMKRRREDEV